VKQDGQGEFAKGVWAACDGWVKPAAETCNGKDDDCNGVVDDGCDCKDGATKACSTKCGDGHQVCASGQWGDCDAPKPDANGSCNEKVNINVDGDCVCAPPEFEDFLRLRAPGLSDFAGLAGSEARKA
jgi:hypothetical protein